MIIVLPIAIICVVLFTGSYLMARRLARRKNRRPEVVIAVGMVIGVMAFAVLWTVSLVYGGGYARLAALGAFVLMPTLVAYIVPPKS